MSIEAAQAFSNPEAMLTATEPYPPKNAPTVASRSLLRQAVLDTWSSRLARTGLAWLALLVFFAIFAPFLANTHPLAMKVAGRWSSPLLHNLTPADVMLLIDMVVALVLVATRPLSFVQSVGLVLWFTALAIPLTYWPQLDTSGRFSGVTAPPGVNTLGSVIQGFLVFSLILAVAAAAGFAGWKLLQPIVDGAHLSSLKRVWLVARALVLVGLIIWGLVRLLLHGYHSGRLHAQWTDIVMGFDWWGIVLLPLLIRPPQRVAAGGGGAAVALVALLIFCPVRPPENFDYTHYRGLAAQGKVESVIYVPIPYSPRDRLRDQPDARLTPPGRQHWLGTDTNGSDLASELIHASRIALSIGFVATGISVVIGIIVGGFMGYYAGLLDLLGMRFMEIFEAVPRLFLLITITAFVEKRDIYLLLVVFGLTGWTGYARFLRAEFFTLRKLDYVQAAIAAGLPRRSILFKHMLPNGLTPILVSTTFGVASAILYESALSFLGLGLVDEASWGSLLNQARAAGTGFIPWIATFPGLMIFLTVFSYNLVGEAVRDALDPKLRKRD